MVCSITPTPNMTPFQIQVDVTKKQGRLTIQCGEIWSVVGNHHNKSWIRLAIDVDNRQILEVCWFSAEEGAPGLWDARPPRDRQRVVSDTDSKVAYTVISPSSGHCAEGKENGKTNHIECFNGTMRQRFSAWLENRFPFFKRRKTILERSGISSITTTFSWHCEVDHYMFRSTVSINIP